MDNKSVVERRLHPINNGTVLDHLPPKTALRITSLLNLDYSSPVTIAINTESKLMGRKDLVFIENKILSEEEINKIGLIANKSTWNTIKEGKVYRKETIKMPTIVNNILRCPNDKCITNYETIPTKFTINNKDNSATCNYCNKEMEKEEIAKHMK